MRGWRRSRRGGGEALWGGGRLRRHRRVADGDRFTADATRIEA
ncbi:MAG: hypothetical protein V3U14_00535 [candidate division NC10 bacterium]